MSNHENGVPNINLQMRKQNKERNIILLDESRLTIALRNYCNLISFGFIQLENYNSIEKARKQLMTNLIQTTFNKVTKPFKNQRMTKHVNKQYQNKQHPHR